MGLHRVVFQSADIQVLHLLDHNLCVSNVSYALWLSHLLSSLPEYLGGYPEERYAISRLINAIRPTLTAEFLQPGRLRCPGLPFSKTWHPPQCFNEEEFTECGRNLTDCVTYGLTVPFSPESVAEPKAEEILNAGTGPSTTSNLVLSVTSPENGQLSCSSPSNDSLSSSSTRNAPASGDTNLSVSPECGSASSSSSESDRSLADVLKYIHGSPKRSRLPKSPFPKQDAVFTLQSVPKVFLQRVLKLWS